MKKKFDTIMFPDSKEVDEDWTMSLIGPMIAFAGIIAMFVDDHKMVTNGQAYQPSNPESVENIRNFVSKKSK